MTALSTSTRTLATTPDPPRGTVDHASVAAISAA
jgi:hypothetical protein